MNKRYVNYYITENGNYINCDKNIREQFLYGYFLGDGHRSLRTDNSIIYSTVSRELAIGAYLLLLSLDKKVSTYKTTKISGKSKYRKYSVKCLF